MEKDIDEFFFRVLYGRKGVNNQTNVLIEQLDLSIFGIFDGSPPLSL